MNHFKEPEKQKVNQTINQGSLVTWASVQKYGRWKLGELGVRKGGHVILHQHNELSLFSVQHFFSTSKLFPTHGVCVCAHECFRARESECVLEVRFGAGTIKALLKHFWCCWLMPKQKESEKKRGSETVREGIDTQWLSQPAQQSAGSLSILWAQRCEMSQQPNSNIKLSWAAERKSRREREQRGFLLMLSPSPDLYSSKPFKNCPLLHTQTHLVPTYKLGRTHCNTFKVLTWGWITFGAF